MRNYPIRLTLEPNPNGVFTVTSPDVPGLVTEGKDAAEIQANVQEALAALGGDYSTERHALLDKLDLDTLLEKLRQREKQPSP